MPTKKLEDLVIRRAQGRNRDALTDHHQEQTDEERILNHVREYGSIDNEQCRALLNTSKRRATYLLNKLYEYGLLSRSGQRRWAQYELPTD